MSEFTIVMVHVHDDLYKLTKQVLTIDLLLTGRKQKVWQEDGNVLRHVCSKCQRSYMHLHHLVAHQRYECGQEPHFMCQLCHKRFYQKQVLYRHIRSIHLKHANFL
ncbi:hypothetical protein J6590_002423 [Homalodisca vitripennis]|nr:hypothetical protein J6590_002423 [Homalodisca vitripennis]